MDADERLPARKCQESFQESFAHTEHWDASSGSNIPTWAHPNESLQPNSHSDSVSDEADEDTSSTVRWNVEQLLRRGGNLRISATRTEPPLHLSSKPENRCCEAFSPIPHLLVGRKITTQAILFLGLRPLTEGHFTTRAGLAQVGQPYQGQERMHAPYLMRP